MKHVHQSSRVYTLPFYASVPGVSMFSPLERPQSENLSHKCVALPQFDNRKAPFIFNHDWLHAYFIRSLLLLYFLGHFSLLLSTNFFQAIVRFRQSPRNHAPAACFVVSSIRRRYSKTDMTVGVCELDESGFLSSLQRETSLARRCGQSFSSLQQHHPTLKPETYSSRNPIFRG